MNVFEVFLPQLLLYPNPTDPLNGEAAALLMREPETYKKKVRGACHSVPACALYYYVVTAASLERPASYTVRATSRTGSASGSRESRRLT